MPRFIDTILSKRGRLLPAPWNMRNMTLDEVERDEREWKSAIAAAHPFIFEASNVCEYFYRGTDQEYWNPERDFPCLAPPGFISWFEYNRPSGLWTTRAGAQELFNKHALPKKTGVICLALDPHYDAEQAEHFRRTNDRFRKAESWWQGEKRPVRDIDKASLLLNFRVFVGMEQEPETAFGPIGEVYLWLDENYDCYEYLMFTPCFPEDPPFHEGAYNGLDNLVYPAMLTVTMLNLKNVKVTSVVPGAERKPKQFAEWRRHYRERHEVDPVIYKTLEIEPIQSLTRKEMASRPSGVADRHHVRSHIYRGYVLRSGVDGRKHLFGNPKITGRFWVKPGKRGGAEEGEVVKDYKMRQVKEGT